MVLRDDVGSIIVSACRFLQTCQSHLEAELEACRHGVSLAIEWPPLICIIEMDSLVAVKMIQADELDRSPHTSTIQEVKQLVSSRASIEFSYISRDQNNVSHVLANYGRTSTRSEVWPSSGPRSVPELCQYECNFVS
jgi:hypothetical protein